MDKIRNEYIRGTAQVGKFGEKTREARLRWYGHLRRKDDGYIGRRMLRMELPGKRKRGRPKRRFMDVVKEDMAEVEVTEEDTVDRNNSFIECCVHYCGLQIVHVSASFQLLSLFVRIVWSQSSL